MFDQFRKSDFLQDPFSLSVRYDFRKDICKTEEDLAILLLNLHAHTAKHLELNATQCYYVTPFGSDFFAHINAM